MRCLLFGCILYGAYFSSSPNTQAAFVYEQNFDSFANGTTNLNDGSVMIGGPHMPQVLEWGPDADRWSALWLTANSQGNLGNFFLPDFVNPTVRIDSFNANFDLMFNTNGNNIYADGFSFNFGRFDNLNANYGGEGGMYSPGNTGDVLTVSWFTFWAGNPRIEVRYNGSTVASSTLVRPTIDFNVTAPSSSFIPVNVAWGANGLNLTYNGTAIFTDLLVSGFEPEEGSTFAFSARTGADSHNTFIDNLSITAIPEPSTALLGLLGSMLLLRRNAKLSREISPRHANHLP
jgi:hypothetical protein